MELRFTRHALEAIAARDISVAEVSEAIATAFATFPQQDTVRYHAMVGRRGLGVVVKRSTFPPLVITVFILDEEWLP